MNFKRSMYILCKKKKKVTSFYNVRYLPRVTRLVNIYTCIYIYGKHVLLGIFSERYIFILDVYRPIFKPYK